MLQLTDLPNELLVLIFEQPELTEEHPRTSLASISLVSKRFHIIVKPILYHTWISKLTRTHRFFLFPHVVLDNPKLLQHVRRLSFDFGYAAGSEMKQGSGKHRLPLPPPQKERKLRRRIKKWEFPKDITEEWLREIGELDEYGYKAFAAFALFLCAKTLEELSLVYGQRKLAKDWYWGYRWYGRNWTMQTMYLSLCHETKKLWTFPHLTTVKISRTEYQDGEPRELAYINLWSHSFFFRIPTLCHFELRGCLEDELGRGRRANYYAGQKLLTDEEWHYIQNSTVQTLIFKESDIKAVALRMVLSCCKAVKRFDLEMAALDDRDTVFDYDVLDFALRGHVDSLDTFRLSFHDECAEERWGSPLLNHRRGSIKLASFHKLQEIDLPNLFNK